MPEGTAMSGIRSVSNVLQDIIGNVQEIVRLEVRLAKTEIREEVNRAKPAGLLLAIGALAAAFALLFLLLSMVHALSIVVPNWAAALIVALSMALVAGATLSAGRKRIKRFHATPERMLRSLKENVEWVQQRTK